MVRLRHPGSAHGIEPAIACDELDLGQPVPDALPVRRTFGFLLQDTSRLVRRRFIQLARAADLPINRSEASVLLHVDHQEGINQTNLAGALDIEPISLVRLLDRLEVLGLIERRRHPTDRRVWTIWLTEASGPMLDRIRAITLRVRDQAFTGFTEARRAALIEELGELHANLLRSPDGA
ncbi:MAG TPA: MarR family winged helix-turn-helix transcriptional regulator [Aliidongia sp.]|nr:MarR family winged helix-turn-helix transcriptional regulator [Aliidongia sp.]